MKKQILSLIMAILLLFSLIPEVSFAADIVDRGTCGTNANWKLTSDGTLTISGKGDMEDFIVDGYPIDAPWIQYQSMITKIIIGEGVTSIGSLAFRDCENLIKISIPRSMKSIGQSAFSGCSKITSADIPKSVESIDDYAFSYCSSLENVSISEKIDLGTEVFEGTPWIQELCNKSNGIAIINNTVIDCDNKATKIIIPSGVKRIADNAFRYCDRIENVTIPSSVTSIGKFAFGHCPNLKSINLPNNITSIEIGVFDGCGSLKNITIPSSVKNIENCAFENCHSLTSIVIPSGVTSIGCLAFYGCRSLTDVSLPKGVKEIGYSAFEDTPWFYELCDNNEGFGIINGTLLRYNGDSKNVIVPNSVTCIDSYAFSCCNKVKKIKIPDSVREVGYSAFDNCSNLESIELPKGIKEIGSFTFINCSSLISVTIPNGVESIGQEVFAGCDNIKSIVIPRSLSKIGPGAFSTLSDSLVLYIHSNPDAVQYAKDNGIEYVLYEEKGNTGIEYAILSNGTYLAEINDEVTWIPVGSDEEHLWYGIDNSNGIFEPGSKFSIKQIDADDEEFSEYYEQIDPETIDGIDKSKMSILEFDVKDDKGESYELSETADLYFELGENVGKKGVTAKFISEGKDEDAKMTFGKVKLDNEKRAMAKVELKHFGSPMLIIREDATTSGLASKLIFLVIGVAIIAAIIVAIIKLNKRIIK